MHEKLNPEIFPGQLGEIHTSDFFGKPTIVIPTGYLDGAPAGVLDQFLSRRFRYAPGNRVRYALLPYLESPEWKGVGMVGKNLTAMSYQLEEDSFLKAMVDSVSDCEIGSA